MLRLSSNMTLVLRIALPVIYLSFFGMFILAIFLVETNFLLLSEPAFRMGLIIAYLLVAALLWFTVLRLRRVEYGQGYLYISNYFKNYRYLIGSIESLKEINIGFATIVKITLLEKGSWGKHIYFLAKADNLETFKKIELDLRYV